MSIRWVATELHMHTRHSDGGFTPEELAQALHGRGFEAGALTDHNCISSTPGFQKEAERLGMVPVPGMEATTFFGHVLSIGTAEYVEWRDLDRETGLAVLSRRIRAAGGLCGLAHPFEPGGWIRTGSYLDYDWDGTQCMDYVEVWNGPEAHRNPFNRRAYRWWLELLDMGIRVPATSGRDWHRLEEPEGSTHACNYLGVPDGEAVTARLLLDAIRAGRVAVTHGPLPVLEIEGDRVRIRVLEGRGGEGKYLMRLIIPGGEALAAFETQAGFEGTVELKGARRVHAEMYRDGEMTGFTSPCYAE